MRYIHSQESLIIPENGEFDFHLPSLSKPASSRDSLVAALDPGRDTNDEHRECYSIEKPTNDWIVKIQIRSRVVTVEGPRGMEQQRAMWAQLV